MIHCFSGQFITNEVAKKDASKGKTSSTNATNNTKSGKKNLKVNVDTRNNDTSNYSQDDDGIGSLPITPTDLGKNKSLSVSKKQIKCDGDTESIPTDDGIYTSSEETINQSRSCVFDSDQVSVVSSEDSSDLTSSKQQHDSNGNLQNVGTSSRQKSNQDQESKLNMVSKVCSGTVSRGLEKFKGKDANTLENSSP